MLAASQEFIGGMAARYARFASRGQSTEAAPRRAKGAGLDGEGAQRAPSIARHTEAVAESTVTRYWETRTL
jgi:hypothetical protein